VAKSPAYVVLGGGRWARRIHSILSGENRRVVAMRDARPRRAETEAEFKARLCSYLVDSGAKIAWICEYPRLDTRWMIESVLRAGLHAIVEKPWLFSPAETRSIKKLAGGRILGVHYQYCLLEGVEKWKREIFPGKGLRFGGEFAIKQPGNSRMPAFDNLGCHLFAIREYAVPASEVAEIQCGYELPDERSVWIEQGEQRLAGVNFVRNKEPIVQRFIQKVEAALDGVAFPFDLEFALRVADGLNAYKNRIPA